MLALLFIVSMHLCWCICHNNYGMTRLWFLVRNVVSHVSGCGLGEKTAAEERGDSNAGDRSELFCRKRERL
jgi:hypothetical protein